VQKYFYIKNAQNLSYVFAGSKNKGEKHIGLQNHQHPNISMPSERKHLPENYVTCLRFLKFAYIYTLGLSGVGKCLILVDLII
jgi:hypothetical protein